MQHNLRTENKIKKFVRKGITNTVIIIKLIIVVGIIEIVEQIITKFVEIKMNHVQ